MCPLWGIYLLGYGARTGRNCADFFFFFLSLWMYGSSACVCFVFFSFFMHLSVMSSLHNILLVARDNEYIGDVKWIM